TKSANVQAGQNFNLALQMESTASAAPSEGASAPVVAAPSDNTLSVQPLQNQNAAGKGGDSAFSMILIAAGALLLLLGIGAIVLILVRRRRDEGDEMDEDDAPPPRRGPTPVAASRGSYRGAPDATSVARGGAYGDPTMVGRGSPLADAPTTVQRQVPIDEY